MPLLPEINIGALNTDPGKQLESLVAQLNEWARLISNEERTEIVNDTSRTPRIIFKQLPDESMGMVISKDGVSVLDVFD